MNVDKVGRDFITKEEGEVLKAYQCTAKVWTIGVGHTGIDVLEGMTITREQSQLLLAKDLLRFENAVNRLVTIGLTQNQYNALISFTFNLGEGALGKSTLLKLINSGDKNKESITKAFGMWQNVNGKPNTSIYNRRMREANLFFS